MKRFVLALPLPAVLGGSVFFPGVLPLSDAALADVAARNDPPGNASTTNANRFASLNTAVAAIGSAPATLAVSDAQTLTSSLTVPRNISLQVLQGGLITVPTGMTLTINGPFTAGLHQVFTYVGTGVVGFGMGSVAEVYPEWWGAHSDGTDVSGTQAAMQYAIDCLQRSPLQPSGLEGDIFPATFGGKLKLSTGMYRIDGVSIAYNPKWVIGANITIEGSGPGSLLQKGTGTTTPLISAEGVRYGGERICQIYLRDFALDGNHTAYDGVFIRTAYRVYLDRLVARYFANAGIHIVQASEFAIRSSMIGCSGSSPGSTVGIMVEGGLNYDRRGVVTAVDGQGGCENFVIDGNVIAFNATNIVLNHANGYRVSNNVINNFGVNAIQVLSRVLPGPASDYSVSESASGDFFGNYTEGDGNGTIVKMQVTDSSKMKSIKFHNNTFTTIGSDKTTIIDVGSTSTNGQIIDTGVYHNYVGFSATSQWPQLVREHPVLSRNTVIENSPIGTYGGSRYGLNTTFPEFTKDLGVASAWYATTNANPWNPTGWSDDPGTVRAAAADSYLGMPTMQLGDGSTTGAIQANYTINTAEYRQKVLIITFLVKSNVAGQFVALFPESGPSDMTLTDSLFANINANATITAAEAASPQYRRMAFFVPIINRGAGTFDVSSATSNLLLRFQRPAGLATDYVRIADLSVRVADKHYDRINY